MPFLFRGHPVEPRWSWQNPQQLVQAIKPEFLAAAAISLPSAGTA